MIASQLALVPLTCGLRMLHVDLGMELGIEFIYFWIYIKILHDCNNYIIW
jgi:hypothetical protein